MEIFESILNLCSVTKFQDLEKFDSKITGLSNFSKKKFIMYISCYILQNITHTKLSLLNSVDGVGSVGSRVAWVKAWRGWCG